MKLSFLLPALGLSLVAATVSALEPLPSDDGSSITTVITKVQPSKAAPLPVAIPADHAAVRYSGRFEKKEDAAMVCAWPASAVTLRFQGTGAVASLGIGGNRVLVVVDGKPVKVLTGNAQEIGKVVPTVKLYSLAEGLPAGEHTITLVKITEANLGNVAFSGFQLPDGAAAKESPAPERKIQVIGDSISAGYGNEAASQKDHFSAETENAYFTYGAMAARDFGADYTCQAWSGRTMWPKFTLPEVYGRTLPRDAASVWAGDTKKPDVILVNLCTNDFSKGAPEEEGWVAAYHAFLAQLRKEAPDATIYCAHGPMISDSYPAGGQAATKSRLYIQRIVKECNDAGDAKVHYLEFPTQNIAADGVGADYHPNLVTHRKMADKFAAAIKQDLGWEPAKQ